MGSVPAWAWLALAVLAAVLLLRRGRPAALAGTQPIRPGYNGSPDKTAQNPKVVPFRG